VAPPTAPPAAAAPAPIVPQLPVQPPTAQTPATAAGAPEQPTVAELVAQLQSAQAEIARLRGEQGGVTVSDPDREPDAAPVENPVPPEPVGAGGASSEPHQGEPAAPEAGPVPSTPAAPPEGERA
jgi:hypothetical protein